MWLGFRWIVVGGGGELGWGKRTLDVPSLVSAFAKAILTICARKGAS